MQTRLAEHAQRSAQETLSPLPASAKTASPLCFLEAPAAGLQGPHLPGPAGKDRRALGAPHTPSAGMFPEHRQRKALQPWEKAQCPRGRPREHSLQIRGVRGWATAGSEEDTLSPRAWAEFQPLPRPAPRIPDLTAPAQTGASRATQPGFQPGFPRVPSLRPVPEVGYHPGWEAITSPP